LNVRLSDEAIQDAGAATDWYIDQGAARAADAFFDDMEQSIQLLLRHPRVGAHGVARTRSLPLHVATDRKLTRGCGHFRAIH
jgi:plasmid stabilization system protein ParE